MNKSVNYTSSISFKLLLGIIALILVISSSIGLLSYNFAKNELVSSGKLDLQHIANTAIPLLDLLNQEVESGSITLAEAKNIAREKIDGPAVGQGNNQHYDFSKSPFVYKDQGYVYAYDQNGNVAMHPDEPIGLDQYNTTNSKGVYVIQEIIKASHSNTLEGHYVTYYWRNPGETTDQEKIAYVLYYQPWGWSIGIGAYTNEFYASLNTVKWLITLVSIGIALISLLIFYFIIKNKMKLLHEVSDASLKIAQGDLDLPYLNESGDEIGVLAASFNVMSKELKNMMSKLKETSSELIGSASDLVAVSEETTASSEEISATMGEISASTMSTSEEIDNTFKQMEILTDSIKKINEESGRIKGVTDISKDATAHGKEMITLLQKANQESEKASDKISIAITNLYQKIKDISHITETIQYITQQTNLLALNASIEAARAGEHGKGFSVVANEVRKLAEESHTATMKIQEMIDGIEKETETTVEYMAETTQSTKQLNESVSDTEEEFASIEKAVFMTIEAVEKLNGEINMVTKQTDQIMDAVQTIASISQQTAASSEEVTASVEEQVKAIANVSQSAEGLNTISDELNSLIRKYQFE